MKYIYLLFFIPFLVYGNPFKIDFPVKETLTNEDLIEVQNKLQTINLKPVLNEFYPNPAPTRSFWQWKTPLAAKEDFYNRISKSLHQTFINVEKGQLPSNHLVKINQGGEHCIVCYVSFNGKYSTLIKSLPKKLEKTGFNGYLY